jgi:GDP-L-fucose synthase
MKLTDRIYVAGHRGMVGAAVCSELKARGFHHLITATHDELDLLDQAATRAFLQREKPDCVIFAAARVGGIEANRSLIGTFLYENLMVATNTIHAARIGLT